MDERLEASLIALRRIFRRTEMSSRSLAKQTGLTPTQLLCLQVIEGEAEPSPSIVARSLSVSHATATALLDRLEARGMIGRTRNCADRRRVTLTLLPSGVRALEAVPGSLQRRFEDRFTSLEEWEKAFLVAALERVASILDADDMEAAPVLAAGEIASTCEGREDEAP